MSKTTAEIPFTELWERAAQIARIESENDRSRVRGAVNDEYTFTLPRYEDWQFFLATSSLITENAYKVGTVSANTQGTTATFSSDVTLTSAFTGRQIFFNGNANVYELTFSATTAATIQPPLAGVANLSAAGYSIFQSRYRLPDNFSRFPRNGGLILFSGGRKQLIPEQTHRRYHEDYTPSPTSNPLECRLLFIETDGKPSVEIVPPPDQAIVFGMEYLQKVIPMRETTAGTVTISANGTNVVFHAGAKVAEMQTGMYIRINAFGDHADSEWYRIIGVNASGSAATLQTAFGTSAASSSGYTVCNAPNTPPELHLAILKGAAMALMTDQNDPQYQTMATQRESILSEAQRNFKARVFNPEVETIAEDWDYRR